MTLLDRYNQRNLSMTNAARQRGREETAARLEGIEPSFMVDFLKVPEIEGWSDSVYVPDGTDTSKPVDGIPGRYVNKSGPSVGNGIDFGQLSIKDFLKAGIEPSVIDKIAVNGGFGATNMDAYVSKGNFERGNFGLTPNEVIHISNKWTAYTENAVRAAMPEGRYDSMRPTERGVVMSLAHLYGPDFYSKKQSNGTRGHRGFQQAVKGEWGALKKNMQNYSNLTTLNDPRNRRAAAMLDPSIQFEEDQGAVTTRQLPVNGPPVSIQGAPASDPAVQAQ